MRKKKNIIERIKDQNGIWVEGDDNIGRVASSYFMGLFNSSFPQAQAVN